VKIGPAVPEICSRTDRQTNWSQYSGHLPGYCNYGAGWAKPIDTNNLWQWWLKTVQPHYINIS